ncbi:aldo/keto reductase [Streptomyces sp. 1222.5]|uniref:aldo/keto reductase n=1 Tax=Streptomyces sp. 1222.5 TaxID=1881026 RepID=UPI003EBB6A3C
MTFGEDWGWGASVADSEAILAHYIERGGNFLDTANIYTNGHSEKIIGDYVSRRGPLRDRLVIATKFVGNLYRGDPNGGGAGRKSIMAAVEHSLRRLQTDYIDLYWMHMWDKHSPIEETMRALDDLVSAGKVRYIGLSDTPAWKVAQAHTIAQFRGWAPLIALQLEYSLLERTAEGELIPMSQELGLGVAAWSPLRSGVLSGKYSRGKAALAGRDWVTDDLSEKTYVLIDELQNIAAERRTSVASVALAWLRQRPGVTAPIIGARRLDQLVANLAALDMELSQTQIMALDNLTAPSLNFPAAFLKQEAPDLMQAGTTVNSEATMVSELTPQTEEERF